MCGGLPMCNDLRLTAALLGAAREAKCPLERVVAIVWAIERGVNNPVALAELYGRDVRGVTRVTEALSARGVIDDAGALAAEYRAGRSVDISPEALDRRRALGRERSRRWREGLGRHEGTVTGGDASRVTVTGGDASPGAVASKSLTEQETRAASVTRHDAPSRARLQRGTAETNQDINLPDLEQERLHTSKDTRAIKAERWLEATVQYAREVLSPGAYAALWRALDKVKPGERRPIWLQRDLDRLDAKRRGLEVPPALDVLGRKVPDPATPQPSQREMLLSIEGGARPPPVPEMFDYRGEGAAPLSAVGD